MRFKQNERKALVVALTHFSRLFPALENCWANFRPVCFYTVYLAVTTERLELNLPIVEAIYINRSSLQCTLAKFKNKCLLDLTFGAPPQTLQRGFWKGILFDRKLASNRKMQNNETLPTKKAIFTLSSMALISFPQESHWSPLAS